MEEEANNKGVQKVGQEQIHGLLFGERVSWQSIIYDLINSEQLNPWDIDLSILANKYLERIRRIEELNFFVSSKVLFAASILLRIKSDIVLNDDLKILDDLLFGRKDNQKYVRERIELEGEIPGLIPRTPLPRFRKVSLDELMSALGDAIKTETRRIKKVVVEKQHEIEVNLFLPKRKINLKDEIEKTYSRLIEAFSKREGRLAFSEFAGVSKEEMIASFITLLHLDNQQKVWLEQDESFGEIWIMLKELYEKHNAETLEKMRIEAEAEMEKLVKEENESQHPEDELLEEAKGEKRGFDKTREPRIREMTREEPE